VVFFGFVCLFVVVWCWRLIWIGWVACLGGLCFDVCRFWFGLCFCLGYWLEYLLLLYFVLESGGGFVCCLMWCLVAWSLFGLWCFLFVVFGGFVL